MARRLVTVIAAGALALSALAGCRVEPGTAAFVGADRITDAQVDSTVSEVQAFVREGDTGPIRQQVLTWLVVISAGRQYAAAHDITVQHEDSAGFAQGLPPGAQNTAYAQAGADLYAVLRALQQVAKSTVPSEADQREAYRNAGAAAQGTPFDQVRQVFSEANMGPTVGLRNLVRDMLHAEHVTISPRYGVLRLPIAVTIEGVQTYLVVDLETAPTTSAVVDAR